MCGLWRMCQSLSRNVAQDHPKEEEIQKAKQLSDGILQTSEAEREVKDKGKKKKYIYMYTQLNAEFQRLARNITEPS